MASCTNIVGGTGSTVRLRRVATDLCIVEGRLVVVVHVVVQRHCGTHGRAGGGREAARGRRHAATARRHRAGGRRRLDTTQTLTTTRRASTR